MDGFCWGKSHLEMDKMDDKLGVYLHDLRDLYFETYSCFFMIYLTGAQ